MSERLTTVPPLSSPWLRVPEAAARAQVSAKTVYTEVARGHLRAARIGGRRDLRFKAEWIDAWLEASATPVDVRRLA
jgi:excisionase family DNA binding protein